MKINKTHTASGPLAGYLFQPERALRHLALSPRGSVVGIETLDDVTVLFSNGQQLREQDKHTTSNKKNIADRSKDLWNSLYIWLKAVDEEELDLPKTQFHLVTNQTLEKGLAFDLMHFSSNDSVAEFVKRLRAAGKNPPKSTQAIVEEVLRHSDENLSELVAQIRVIDASSASHGLALREEIADSLHLPPLCAREIIQGLLGWIDETTLDLIRQNKPAWFTRDAFSEQYRRLLFRYQDLIFIRETEEALIPIREEDRRAQRRRLFVKQLRWVGIPEDGEQMLDAIDDYIRSGTEATRLTQGGLVHPADFRAFEERLIRRWKMLRRTQVPGRLPTKQDQLMVIGRTLLDTTLNHRESLAGQQTSEYYLTQGAYHRLADDPPRLGWHPNYEDKIKALNNVKEDASETRDRS